MLATAGRLFERQGYARTTFDEIAAASGFAVATVYKYFPSKERIVVALLQPDLERILALGQAVIERPPDDPADAMVGLLSRYRDLGGHNWASREILRLTVFPRLDNGGLLSEFIRDADARVQGQIRLLLETLRRRGRLAPGLPLDDATAILFALLNQHFGAFLADGASRFTQTFRRLARTIRLVFDDWRPPPGPRRRRRRPAAGGSRR